MYSISIMLLCITYTMFGYRSWTLHCLKRLPEEDYQSIIETLQIKFCQLTLSVQDLLPMHPPTETFRCHQLQTSSWTREAKSIRTACSCSITSFFLMIGSRLLFSPGPSPVFDYRVSHGGRGRGTEASPAPPPRPEIWKWWCHNCINSYNRVYLMY